jgi:hypothetical protein
LSRKVLKRHGKELQCHFDKKFVGDLGEVVDITEDFKRDRFREIQRCCEVDRSVREKHNGNPPVNKYLEHHNSGGEFSGNPYTCAAYAAQAETRELNQIGLGQIPRWPVGREAMHRVVPRLLKGKRPPPPKLETYSFVPPLELQELPWRWRTEHPGLDAPYASEELVLPVPEVPSEGLGALSLGASPIDQDWDSLTVDLNLLGQLDPKAIAMFNQLDYHSRFKLNRQELFSFLLYRVGFNVMADLFLLQSGALQARLQGLLSPTDQAVVFW